MMILDETGWAWYHHVLLRYQLCLCLSYLCFFIFQSFPNSIQISADSEATSVTLRELSVLTSQRSLQQLGQRCFEPDAVVVSISLLKSKILGCIRCIMSSLTNLYNYTYFTSEFSIFHHLFVVHPLLSTKKLATKRPVEPARWFEVAVPGVLEPLACEPCRPLTGGAPWKGQGWQIRLGKVSMMILGVSKK